MNLNVQLYCVKYLLLLNIIQRFFRISQCLPDNKSL